MYLTQENYIRSDRIFYLDKTASDMPRIMRKYFDYLYQSIISKKKFSGH